MRRKAVENLSGSTRASDTQLIRASLHDRDTKVRCAAVRALAKTPFPESQTSLVAALKDPSFEVRAVAARVLGQAGNLSCADALAVCLRDPDAAVRISAAGALRSLGWKPSTREELAWFEIALGNTPAALPADHAPECPADVPNQDTAFFRLLAAEELRERRNPNRTALLLSQVRSNDLLTRLSAIHDLGQVTDPEVTPVLLGLFRDHDPEIRLAAAKVVAQRDETPPAHFLGLLQDSSPEVRLEAVRFLGRIRHEQIVQVLSPLLSDPSQRVREATGQALAQIGNDAAVEALVVGLAEQNHEVRQDMECLLEKLDPDWRRSEGALNARRRLVGMLDRSSPCDSLKVQEVLELIRTPQVVPC